MQNYVKILSKATVVTPTIGTDNLLKAVESVEKQDYGNVRHLIVVDGAQHTEKVKDLIKPTTDRQIMVLPENVGKNGFYGHRVYAGISHFINSDYILFLDEDNWYDSDHVNSLINTIEMSPMDTAFSFSLRKIWEADLSASLVDNCESLGFVPVWVDPIWTNMFPNNIMKHRDKALVDTSSYIFKTKFLHDFGHLWHWGWGADRRFFQIMNLNNVPYTSSKKHTLNYRLDGNPNSVKMDFFLKGNEFMDNWFISNPGISRPWLP